MAAIFAASAPWGALAFIVGVVVLIVALVAFAWAQARREHAQDVRDWVAHDHFTLHKR